MKTEVVWQSSPWWLLACVAAGLLYALLLYTPTARWSRATNYGLAALRAVAVAAAAFLLLNLWLRQTSRQTEQKTVVLAVDNSTSVGTAGRLTLPALRELKTTLEKAGYAVAVRTLEGLERPLDSVAFNHKTTNLSGLLGQIKADFEGKYVSDVVLLSDGLANEGYNPSQMNFTYPVHTLGLGDSVARRDVQLRAAYANRIATLGNAFPVQADVVADDFAGKTTTVLLRQNGQVVGRQTLSFRQQNATATVNFQAVARRAGLQRLTVEVLPLPGETNPGNNRRDVFVEVLEQRQNVLLVAPSPHPDLKALRAILEKNENGKLTLWLQSEGTPFPASQRFDLVVVHQFPENAAPPMLRSLLANTPAFFIGSGYTTQKVARWAGLSGQTDRVSALMNPSFSQIQLDPTAAALLSRLTPLLVPFGDVSPMPGSETVLFQKKGNVGTTRPLLLLNAQPPRQGLLLGEGLWQWRLDEYELTDRQTLTDELFGKVMQYLVARDDQRKFRVSTTRPQYRAEETVIFETEAYNALYERVHGLTIRLTLTPAGGRPRLYTYTTDPGHSRFELSGLPPGHYRFRAETRLQNKNEAATGEFMVQQEPLEALTTTADFNLLREVSKQTGGWFLPAHRLGELQSRLLDRRLPDRLTATDQMQDSIHLKWIFFLIMGLLGLEWGLRKYLGQY